MVEGHICKVIQRTGPSVYSDISDKLITYGDSNRIYWYNINQFTTLYDFNKNAGETWTIITDTCDLLITVDSTGVDTINGFPLKSLYVSSENHAFNGKILEHIGHVSRPNPDIAYHCYNWVVDITYYKGLRCYEDSAFGFHTFGIAPSCDYISTDISETANQADFFIYPNPASNNLNIQINIRQVYNFRIFNSFGQLVNTGTLESNNESVDITGLANGIYNIELLADNKTTRRCFIVER